MWIFDKKFHFTKTSEFRHERTIDCVWVRVCMCETVSLFANNEFRNDKTTEQFTTFIDYDNVITMLLSIEWHLDHFLNSYFSLHFPRLKSKIQKTKTESDSTAKHSLSHRIQMSLCRKHSKFDDRKCCFVDYSLATVDR